MRRRVTGFGLLLVLVGFALAGCAHPEPIEITAASPPALVRIHAAMRQTIDAALADERVGWHSGWMGNILVNAVDNPARSRGLCWHWQDLVYDGVAPTLAEVGWSGVGVGKRMGTMREHHAVVVFDPRLVDAARLLTDLPSDAYVLDAWASGAAEVYLLPDWIGPAKDDPARLVIEHLPYGEAPAAPGSNNAARESTEQPAELTAPSPGSRP